MVAARSLALVLALTVTAAPPSDDVTLQKLDSGTTRKQPRDTPRPFQKQPSSIEDLQRQYRQVSTTSDGIPELDRKRVSLDLSAKVIAVSLRAINDTTVVVGDVIQNSAVRYQTFLRLFRPLFRGLFEIKGLDPTTTTTNTSTTKTPVSNDSRRR